MPYQPQDYDRLRELLIEEESFPTQFTLKFIGRNSERFRNGVVAFEGRIPGLQHQSSRESSGGKHLALTYVLAAGTADEIIAAMQAASQIDDVMILL